MSPNWSDEQRARAAALGEARRAERRAKEAQAAAAEAADAESVRRQMQEVMRRMGLEGGNFIACRRGKPPIFGGP
jgi:hypothetical protein